MLVWLVAGSARADAPQCDSRGAITFAPNPTLEEPNASVDIGQADDCSTSTPLDALSHGRTPSTFDIGTEAARTSLTNALMILPATPTGVVCSAPIIGASLEGARNRVDRPPR